MKPKNNNKSNKVNIILRKVFKIFLVMLIIYNAISVVLTTFKLKPHLNLFGTKIFLMEDKSMKPSIGKNDIIITKEYNNIKPQVNDIIAYYKNNQLVIHKIVQENKFDDLYTTKGENNYYLDEEKVEISEIEGKVVLNIPFIGIVFKIFRSKIMTVIIVIYLVLLYKYNKVMKEKRIKRRKKKLNN